MTTRNFKQEIVELLREGKSFKKFKIKEILELDEESKPVNNSFEKDLENLLKEGILKKNSKHEIYLSVKKDFFISKIHFTSKGSAFVLDKDSNQNYFIPKENTLNALNEDVVMCEKIREGNLKKKPEARVLCVIERTLKKLVGTYMKYTDSYGFVIPDDERITKDFYITKKLSKNADSYDKVLINITKYPSVKKSKTDCSVINPEAEIVEIIGMTGEKGVDTLSVVKANDIRDEFPPEVKREASEYSLTLDKAEIDRRLDLRDEIIFTIDGEDAKDLDDAVSIKRTENGYKLGVHIADVSHYVKEYSEIDKEAILRGTSVYLVEKVIPMLPKVLSNNLCSLNEHEDKLTLSCLMEFDNDANLINSEIKETVINSKARLNYTETSAYIHGKNDSFETLHPGVSDSILLSKELAEKLFQKRKNRGSIEFDFDETKIILDENGEVEEIKPYERDIANDIIEEFMLAANETVAKTFYDAKIPFIYRIHENPREERFDNFRKIASLYGLETFEEVTPKAVSNFIEKNKDNENIEMLKILLLQSMQQARYNSTCSEHFGLAASYYCHFTSPIRRYPDLQIHRIIKLYINGKFNEVMKEKYEKITTEIADHCSRTERIADNAEKELDRIKISEYMMQHAGDEFIGRVRSFNKVGMYIQLENTAEGFVKPVNFTFNEKEYKAIYNGEEIKLGTKVKCSPIAIGKDKEVVLNIIEILD